MVKKMTYIVENQRVELNMMDVNLYLSGMLKIREV